MFGLAFGEREDAFFTALDESSDAIFLNIEFCFQVKILLYIDLHPESLTVKAILIALLIALHGFKALIKILVRAAPGMMDAHRIVGRDRAIHERVSFLALRIAAYVLLADVMIVPPILDTGNKWEAKLGRAVNLPHLQLAAPALLQIQFGTTGTIRH